MMKTIDTDSCLCVSAVAVILCLSSLVAAAAENPEDGPIRIIKQENTDLERFIPADGNTVYNAAGLLRSWPKEGPKELWRANSLCGKSAVVEAGGRAFTMAQIDDKQYGVCLDPLTGKILWKALLLPKGNTHFQGGPVASPVVDGDRVYFIPYDNEKDPFKPHCPVVCVKTGGTELWRENDNVWATEGSTPLVIGDVLYVASSHVDTLLMAVDKMTGRRLWAAKCPMPGPWKDKVPFTTGCSLTYQKVAGIPQIITAVYYSQELLGFHAGKGELMWRWKLPKAPINGLISTPVAVGPRLFVSAGDGGNFSACLEMVPKDGKIELTVLYSSEKLQTNFLNTVAIYDGAVFGFGSGENRQAIQCTNFADGNLLWQNEGPDWYRRQQLIVADGLIFALTRKGEVALLEASRKGYKELGRVYPGMAMGLQQQPTLANGRLYIRGEDTIVCYQVAEKMTPAGGEAACQQLSGE